MYQNSAAKDKLFKYSKGEIESLIWYSGSEYDQLNDALRQKKTLSPKLKTHWDNIQSACNFYL